MVGVTQNTLSAYMRDTKTPTLDTVVRFAKILKVPIGYLCGEDMDTYSSKFKTYGDVISVLMQLQGIPLDEKSDFTLFPYATVIANGGGKSENMVVLFSGDEVIQKFLEDQHKMYWMCTDGTIDREMYDAWLMKKGVELSKTPLPFSEGAIVEYDLDLEDGKPKSFPGIWN